MSPGVEDSATAKPVLPSPLSAHLPHRPLRRGMESELLVQSREEDCTAVISCGS